MLDARFETRRGSFRLEVELRSEGVVAIMGKNGSGKTTLLRSLLGAERAIEGRIALGDRVLFDSAKKIDVPIEERGLAYVPQGYGLFPHLDVERNVIFGARDRSRAHDLLDALEIRSVARRRPAELSGGEKQRVALARALASAPRMLLLDEPLAALDADIRPKVRRFLRDWLESTGLPALIVTHDEMDAQALAARPVVLHAEERGSRVAAELVRMAEV
jgi:ABC-type sulfate/molybdate transport systems ATPase subunit